MIIIAQVFLILLLEFAMGSWIWLAAVPLAFGLASGASTPWATGRGAVAGGAAWLGAALYFYLTSGSIIAGRMAAMFGIGAGRGWLLVLISGLLGALVAGLAAYCGASLRVFKRKRPGKSGLQE